MCLIRAALLLEGTTHREARCVCVWGGAHFLFKMLSGFKGLREWGKEAPTLAAP